MESIGKRVAIEVKHMNTILKRTSFFYKLKINKYIYIYIGTKLKVSELVRHPHHCRFHHDSPTRKTHQKIVMNPEGMSLQMLKHK
jgi:hypothetical protein